MYTELTNIDSLRIAYADRQITHPESCFFVSNWDSDITSLTIDRHLVQQTDIYSYQFSPFFDEYKDMIHDAMSPAMKRKISRADFAILNNGTSAFLLLALTLIQKKLMNWLCISPVYFSHLNVLEELNAEICITQPKLSPLDGFTLDFNALEQRIVSSGIQVILATNPMFGIGQELDDQVMNQLAEVANAYDIQLLVDNIYGGMSWDSAKCNMHLIDERMVSVAAKASNYAVIESLSKKTLTNGAKSALMFSLPSIVQNVEDRSLYTTGSLCGTQLELLRILYSGKYREPLMRYARSILNKAQAHYKRIHTLAGRNSFKLFFCNSGYYALGGFKKAPGLDDMSIAHYILEETGVLTIPHSRYLFDLPGYYCFRINLLGDEERTIHSLLSIAHLAPFH